MLFAAICLDKPGSIDLRLATRAAHLAFLEANAPKVKLGGPFLDEADKPVGSLLILDCETEAIAKRSPRQRPLRQGWTLFARRASPLAARCRS